MSKIINGVASEYDFPFKDFNVNYDEECIQRFNRWQDPTIEEYKKEIERLNNIINELENKIKEYINTSVFYEEFEKAEHYRQILIELKELKEKSDKE